MSELVRLFGATDRVYVAERGVRDDRARLALREGQCHGLALALRRRTGWPLVATDNATTGVCEHVMVRHPDGQLVDILGGHPGGGPPVSAGPTTARDVNEAYIDELVDKHGWAEPDIEAAASWIDGVLERTAGPPDPPHRRFECVIDVRGGYELLVVWTGRGHMERYVRAPARSTRWADYGTAGLGRDRETGRRLIDFTKDEFDGLIELIRQHFDPEQAEQVLMGDAP